jgi:hypothetical protein
MLDCPKCGVDAYDGTSCAACHFVAGGGKKRSSDAMHGICEFMDLGQRCAKPGSMSPARRGEGPWYCWDHFALVVLGRSNNGKPPAPPADGFKPLKDLLRHDAEAAAERRALSEEL